MEPKVGEDLESGEWVLDSLVGYLRSPAWQEPLMKFLEDKSAGKKIPSTICYQYIGFCLENSFWTRRGGRVAD